MCYSLRNARSIHESNDLVQLQVAILTVVLDRKRVDNITDLSPGGDEEVGSSLGQVILVVWRSELWFTFGVGEPILVVQITVWFTSLARPKLIEVD